MGHYIGIPLIVYFGTIAGVSKKLLSFFTFIDTIFPLLCKS